MDTWLSIGLLSASLGLLSNWFWIRGLQARITRLENERKACG